MLFLIAFDPFNGYIAIESQVQCEEKLMRHFYLYKKGNILNNCLSTPL